MLPLSPPQQWTLHHILLDRIELERRSPATVEPPPLPVFTAFEKIESGDSWFMPDELRSMRAELRWYLRRNVHGPPDRATVERLIDLITDVLERRRPSPQSLSTSLGRPPQ